MQNFESPLTDATVTTVKSVPVVAEDNSSTLISKYNVVRRNGKLTRRGC